MKNIRCIFNALVTGPEEIILHQAMKATALGTLNNVAVKQ